MSTAARADGTGLGATLFHVYQPCCLTITFHPRTPTTCLHSLITEYVDHTHVLSTCYSFEKKFLVVFKRVLCLTMKRDLVTSCPSAANE